MLGIKNAFAPYKYNHIKISVPTSCANKEAVPYRSSHQKSAVVLVAQEVPAGENKDKHISRNTVSLNNTPIVYFVKYSTE